MQNIKLTLQYDGTRYLGWKRPEKDHNDRTVSYKIENVLEKVFFVSSFISCLKPSTTCLFYYLFLNFFRLS